MMRAHLVLVATLALPAPAFAQDAEAGERLFRRCASCHQVGEDAKNRTGPILNGIIGRAAGSIEDFGYSDSMTAASEAGLVWTEDTIFNYLAGPTDYLRELLDNPRAKAKMTFRLRDEQDRRDVIAYLATFSPAMSEQAGVCVTNGSEHDYLFAAEANGADRITAPLAPGETLCADGDEGGVVSVFESEEALEGCSRIVAPGEADTLIAYSEFDRCAWASNTN